MSKKKLIPAVAVAAVLIAIGSPKTSTEQSSEKLTSRAITETIEVSISETLPPETSTEPGEIERASVSESETTADSQESSSESYIESGSANTEESAPHTDAPDSQPEIIQESTSPETDFPERNSNSGNRNFDTYNNPEQQQTTETYVLNTNSKKIHHPGCSAVKDIKPENYAESNLSVEELEAQGYTKCGKRGDW